VVLETLEKLYSASSGTGPVFASAQDGQALLGPRHWFEPAVAKAQVADFTWHCLRHTFASRLVMAGVDLRTVQQLLGYKTLQMTVRYSHLAPEHQLAAVERRCEVPPEGPSATRTATGPGAAGHQPAPAVN